MCEQFSCLPSQLAQEDAEAISEFLLIRSLIHKNNTLEARRGS